MECVVKERMVPDDCQPVEKSRAAVTKSIVVLLTATAVLLTFFLLQSKLTGSEPAVFGHKSISL